MEKEEESKLVRMCAVAESLSTWTDSCWDSLPVTCRVFTGLVLPLVSGQRAEIWAGRTRNKHRGWGRWYCREGGCGGRGRVMRRAQPRDEETLILLAGGEVKSIFPNGTSCLPSVGPCFLIASVRILKAARIKFYCSQSVTTKTYERQKHFWHSRMIK